MKIPEPFFVIINPVMRTLLRSPLHSILSKSILLITFTGRKSGRQYTTPVRYIRVGDAVQCFTTIDTMWWRNLTGGAEVTLRIEGREARFMADAIRDDHARVRAAVEHYLSLFPEDAAYQDIGLTDENKPAPEALDRAMGRSVLVEARLL